MMLRRGKFPEVRGVGMLACTINIMCSVKIRHERVRVKDCIWYDFDALASVRENFVHGMRMASVGNSNES